MRIGRVFDARKKDSALILLEEIIAGEPQVGVEQPPALLVYRVDEAIRSLEQQLAEYRSSLLNACHRGWLELITNRRKQGFKYGSPAMVAKLVVATQHATALLWYRQLYLGP